MIFFCVQNINSFRIYFEKFQYHSRGEIPGRCYDVCVAAKSGALSGGNWWRSRMDGERGEGRTFITSITL